MSTLHSQWIFPVSALDNTPSVQSQHFTRDKELYDRSRAVELLFRLGSTLQLPSAAMFTAATWLHRFYMRFSMQDYHRQDIAGACVFLATKTEECGRRLRDVAWMCCMKVNRGREIPQDSPEVDQTMASLLAAEEVVLDALCFDFVTTSPHAEIAGIAEKHDEGTVHDHAWTLAHDSYRTPLCVLFPARIIGAACYILAQYLVDGPHSQSLDARLSINPPSASLPTPPTHKATSPDASRIAIEYWQLSEGDLRDVAEAITILLEFYHAHDIGKSEYMQPLTNVTFPTLPTSRTRVYTTPFSQLAPQGPGQDAPPARSTLEHTRTPSSMHGESSPAPSSAQNKGWKPVEPASDSMEKNRLDLS